MKLTKIIILINLAMINYAYSNESSTEPFEPKQMLWRFDGMLGKFDKASIQRGFQVYKEVCSACHSVNLLSYRNLQQVGFSIAEVKALAAEHSVVVIDDNGDEQEKPAAFTDYIVGPYKNEKQARASNAGSYPPDLSLIVKAREDGANYIHALLTGYHTPPAGVVVPESQYYNPYFAGHFIAMPPPLVDGRVTYLDGTINDVEQMSLDIVNFLQWAAEPEMEHRKSLGIKVLAFLSITTLLFYLAKCRIWARLNR